MFNKAKIFLFQNTTLKQTILKNTFWLSFGQITSRLIRAILVIYAARVLGAAGYGAFSYILSLAGLFTIFSDIGLTALITREISKKPELRNQYFSTAFFIKLVFMAFSTLLILFAAPAMASIKEVIPLFPIIAILFAFDSMRDFTFGLTRSLEKMEIEAGVNIFTNLSILILGGAALLIAPDTKTLLISYTIGSGLGLSASLWYLKEYFLKVWQFFNQKLVKKFITEAWPLGLWSVFGGIMINTDILMLGWLRTAEEVGFYSAAQRPVLLFYILPGLIAVSLFPAFSRLANVDNDKFRSIFEKSIGAVFIIALPLVVGGWILAPEVVALIFGDQYSSSVSAFKILLLTTLLVFPGTLIGNAIFAYNRQKILVAYLGMGAIGNVFFNYFLIIRYGIVGSAIATVLSQTITNGLNWRKMKSINNFKTLSQLPKIIVATILMGGITFGLKLIGLHILINFAISAPIYFLILYFIKEPLIMSLKK